MQIKRAKQIRYSRYPVDIATLNYKLDFLEHFNIDALLARGSKGNGNYEIRVVG